MIYMIMTIIVALSSAQRHESFEGFISGIRANAVKGEVFYQRGDGKFNLEAGHKLQEGDFIKTEANSYAELLLQPGNYLRIAGESEFQIFSDPHDKMRLKLNHGSITFEILAIDGDYASNFYATSQTYHLIRLITPNAQVFITRPGIFRINSSNAERTELIVRDGEAVINGQRVKEKRSGTAANGGVAIVEIDPKLEDGFDLWGRERAEELVQANKLLKHESPWAKKQKDGDETSVDLPADETESKNQRLVVSARPGAVNFVEAGVEFSRPDTDWEELTEKSQLEAGDKVRTSDHTFAELTILPDISLRIDSKSEILLDQLSYDGILVKVLQGSAILDVARFEKKEIPEIALVAASTSIVIADEGNYRLDVQPNVNEIMVRKGKVFFRGRPVSGCRKITAGIVSDCVKKRSDTFDTWSEHRGEGKLYDGLDVISLAAHLDEIRRKRFRNTGFWFQNPGRTDYTFVPFTYSSFRSPYGRNYSTVLSPRRKPRIRADLGDSPTGRYPIPRITRTRP